ncbi:MAG: tetratricopeptide repeat protein [Bacteroidales bacterium]|nr:tetratricopeptide repeat protein [Bacteroidales bacterium]
MTRFHIAIIALLPLLISAAGLRAQSVIPLSEDADGRYTMDATLNGVGVKTYYAPENWYASVSTTTYLFLYQNGYIVPADVNGMTTVKMPNGSSTKAASFVIRNLRLGRVIVQNLPAFVITKQNVPLVVGNAAFDCFGTVSVEDGQLVIDDRFEDEIAASPEPASDGPAEPEPSPAEVLAQQVQAHMAAKDYAAAADEFAQLQEMGVLTMYSEYQYAMVLNILHRSEDCLALTRQWLAENEGKSLTLDYWMYDAQGDCYARQGDKARAIRCYEDAVAAYCMVFGTDEKKIRKSQFKDETLGYTLYDLAMQYGATDITKTRYYVTLAAKCGNGAAMEYCRRAGYGF